MAAPQADTSPPSTPAPDDLTVIHGIGTGVQNRLNEKGIQTYAQLANSTPEDLHPIQLAFWETHGLQCGFCTPGILMTLVPFLEQNPDPSEEEIREAIAGNLCRCTGYQHIVDAVKLAAERMGR